MGRVRKSVTVTVDGDDASWTDANRHKVTKHAPSEFELARIGLERKGKYKVTYTPDPNGKLSYRSEFSAGCGVPDVRTYQENMMDYSEDYVDVCFLKGSGWKTGTRLTRTITYDQP